MMCPPRSVILLALAAFNLTSHAANLQAGAFAQDITPRQLPSPINGSTKGNFAKTVNDPMYARSLAVSDGRTEIILCVVDACMIPREIGEAAKALAARATGPDPTEDLARSLGALGYAIGHTGPARALIFAPGTLPPHSRALLREAGLRQLVQFHLGP